MSELPAKWLDVELSEVAEIIRGVTYKREQAADAPQEGFVPVLRATNITGAALTFDGLVYVPTSNVSDEQLLQPGDVVIASSSGSKEIVGKAGAFAGRDFIGSFGAFCTGTAEWRQQHPPVETGAQLLQRILTERRARWEAKQLAKFKQQGKTPPKDWQKKYPEPVQPDTNGLPDLPQGWVWASLDMLGEIASGVAKGTKRDAGTVVREVPYLRVANVQRGYLDLSEVKTILATERDIEELTLVDGDVLFNEGGDRDKLGRGWVWREEVEGCIHQNHVFRMRPYLPQLQPELISHHGNSFGKLWFQNAGKQTTNLASINMTMLRAFPVPVAPTEEQVEVLEQISAQLDSLDRQEAAVDLALKQSTAQRQNILRAAFSGQLVPQDPADEPASVLLARIRAERAAHETTKKSRSRPAKDLT